MKSRITRPNMLFEIMAREGQGWDMHGEKGQGRFGTGRRKDSWPEKGFPADFGQESAGGNPGYQFRKPWSIGICVSERLRVASCEAHPLLPTVPVPFPILSRDNGKTYAIRQQKSTLC
jgi:hypothetical protein